jgi:hypothetical protein
LPATHTCVAHRIRHAHMRSAKALSLPHAPGPLRPPTPTFPKLSSKMGRPCARLPFQRGQQFRGMHSLAVPQSPMNIFFHLRGHEIAVRRVQLNYVTALTSCRASSKRESAEAFR